MNKMAWRAAAAAVVLASVGVAAAQAPQTVRVRGAIEKVDGNTVVVRAADGADVTLTLTANAQIVGVVKATLADIKPGSFVGSAAMPQADGSQKALAVHIFPEAQRGTGEGFRAWDLRPNSTMTNATVAETVAGTDGQNILVKYKDGEKKIAVGPECPIVTYAPGKLDELKPGAKIFINAATKQADGTLSVPRINVGRDAAPPM